MLSPIKNETTVESLISRSFMVIIEKMNIDGEKNIKASISSMLMDIIRKFVNKYLN